MYKAIFIDDDKGASVYAALLNKPDPGGLEVEFVQPNLALADLSAKILVSKPQLLLLDYRLDQNPGDNANQNRYKAGPLAQLLRDHAIDTPVDDLPIVLLSNEENIRRLFVPDQTAHDLFDDKNTKQRLQREPSAVRTELLALINGYARAKRAIKSRRRLALLLDIKGSEIAVVSHQALEAVNNMAAPHLIVGHIFLHLISRNGLLLDDSSVVARLGVAPSSPDATKLIELLHTRGIGYSGILGEGWRRWWAHRLLDDLRDFVKLPDLFGLGADKRVKALNEVFKLKLKPATSRWTKKTDALVTFACASCGQPTEMAVSVAAYDPYPHPFGERRRICYTCVVTGEYEGRNLRVDERDEFAREQLVSGKLKPPA
jgi:hypothetical protein